MVVSRRTSDIWLRRIIMSFHRYSVLAAGLLLSVSASAISAQAADMPAPAADPAVPAAAVGGAAAPAAGATR